MTNSIKEHVHFEALAILHGSTSLRSLKVGKSEYMVPLLNFS